MDWSTTTDVARYDAIAGDFLRSRPVENTVLVTVLEALRARGSAAYGDTPAVLGSWRPAAVCGAGAFVHTPPFPMLLSVMPREAVDELAEALDTAGRRPSGVTAREELATGFAARWQAVTVIGPPSGERRGLSGLARIRPGGAPGRPRPARPGDRDLLLE